VTLTGRAAAQVKDAITFRGRAGWAVDNFLPYVFGGVAVGRMDVSRSVTSSVTMREDTTSTTTNSITGVATTNTVRGPTVAVPAQSQTLNEERTNAFAAGWTGGLGLEYMLWDCVFLRGEWEYVKFLSVKNTVVQANNLHFGIGYKF
jgi:opacity protein-like surface antigen